MASLAIKPLTVDWPTRQAWPILLQFTAINC